MIIASILALGVLASLLVAAIADTAQTKFWACVVGIVFLALLPFQSASITRGSVAEGDTLSVCGLREGVIYTRESNVEHTNYRTLIVVRNDSDYTHRACMLNIGGVPERFVVTNNRAVEVTDTNGPIGDTDWEHDQVERERRDAQALYEGNFGQAQDGDTIVVTGRRDQ